MLIPLAKLATILEKKENMHVITNIVQMWPSWLRTVFTISGCLFVVALIVLLAIRLPPTSVGVTYDEPLIDPEMVNSVATYTGIVTGVITPLLGLYGQVLATKKANAEKARLELEIEKIKLELEQKNAEAKRKRKPPRRKTKSTH